MDATNDYNWVFPINEYLSTTLDPKSPRDECSNDDTYTQTSPDNASAQKDLSIDIEENMLCDLTPDPEYLPKSDSSLISLIAGPEKNQVKDYHILPTNVLHIKHQPNDSDYIVIKLICDKLLMREDREIFLHAISAKYAFDGNDCATLPKLKITHFMVPGKTKGLKFALSYTLVSNGVEKERLVSQYFRIWSSVNQSGFPRHIRDYQLAQRAKFNSRKKRKIIV